MENSVYAKIPICYACASGSGEPPAEAASDPHLNEDDPERIPDSERGPIEEQAVQLPDPYLNPLQEIVLDTGIIPCSVHGYDHLSRDPTCEFCEKAIGPLYRHLSKKYGTSLGDQTPCYTHTEL